MMSAAFPESVSLTIFRYKNIVHLMHCWDGIIFPDVCVCYVILLEDVCSDSDQH